MPRWTWMWRGGSSSRRQGTPSMTWPSWRSRTAGLTWLDGVGPVAVAVQAARRTRLSAPSSRRMSLDFQVDLGLAKGRARRAGEDHQPNRAGGEGHVDGGTSRGIDRQVRRPDDRRACVDRVGRATFETAAAPPSPRPYAEERAGAVGRPSVRGEERARDRRLVYELERARAVPVDERARGHRRAARI